MSDTPRTDAREALSEGLHEGWGLALARQLERELNARRLWIHFGKGHCIGSTVIVYAESAEAAEPIIRAELVCLGLADEELDISEIEPCDGVIFSDSGDY